MHPGRQDELSKRVVRAAEAALAHPQYVSALYVLTGTGLLAATHLEAWKKGRVDFLERVIHGNLEKISLWRCSSAGPRRKASSPARPATSAVPAGKLWICDSATVLGKAAQPAVFLILRDSRCSECSAEIDQGSLLFMEAGQPLGSRGTSQIHPYDELLTADMTRAAARAQVADRVQEILASWKENGDS